MFEIGDSVVYPMHGAGIIENIEEKKILGENKRYYTMKIPYGNIMVMIPLDNIEKIGLRSIVSENELCNVFETVLCKEKSCMSENWNRRYRENMEKIKTGDIYEVAEVIKNLMLMDKGKGLSTGEKKLLSTAKQILYSEIMLVREVDYDTANQIVVEKIFALHV